MIAWDGAKAAKQKMDQAELALRTFVENPKPDYSLGEWGRCKELAEALQVAITDYSKTLNRFLRQQRAGFRQVGR